MLFIIRLLTTALRSLGSHHRLILPMVKRDILGRYRGSILGLAWSFFNPLLLLSVYTFVFSVVFQARWGPDTSNTSHSQFAVILFAGLLISNLFAECINRAPSLIVYNTNYVKKVVFPLETLPIITLYSALFHLLVSFAVLLVAQIIIVGSIPITALYFPLLLVPFLLLILGASWLLAGLGVYVRDIAHATGLFTTVLTFMSPIFYPISALPEKLRIFVQLSPLTFIVEQTRSTVIFGNALDWAGWSVYLAISLASFAIGLAWFQVARRGFADVL